MSGLTLESLLTSKSAGFGLPASPLQRALCRAADGLPLEGVLTDEALEAHFGCTEAELLARRPSLVTVIAGVRGGKSVIAASAALKAAMTADLSALLPHELARVAIVAPTVDNATATFNLLLGAIQGAPALRGVIEGDPTSESLIVRRADGRRVEVVVVAAHRGAITLRSRWLAGFVFDEAALFGAEMMGAAVTAEELLRGAEPRLVRGGQGWIVSSPFGPQGLLHELWKAHFGKPGRVLVVHAPTTALNPAYDREQIADIRRRDPDAAAREYDAQWADASSTFIPSVDITRCTRADGMTLPPVSGGMYAAAMDPATRGNGWTLAVTSLFRRPDGLLKHRVVLVHEWRGSKVAPLDPDLVFASMAAMLRLYGVTHVSTDQHSLDALRVIARLHGLTLEDATTNATNRTAGLENLRTLFANGQIEIPPHAALRSDLMAVTKKATPNGIAIHLPKTPDGRHCDYVPSLTLACMHAAKSVTTGENLQVRARQAHLMLARFGWADLPRDHHETSMWSRVAEAQRLAREQAAIPPAAEPKKPGEAA